MKVKSVELKVKNMKKKIKYILFDTDGVLVHSRTWSDQYSENVGLPPWSMKDFFTGVFQKCIIWEADLREVITSYLEKWWWSWSADEYIQSWCEYENKPDIELISKIQDLRKEGIKCYIATNQEKYRLEFLRNKMRFDEYFDGVFCSAEIGYKKPQKEYFEYILSVLSVPPDQILYFDDAEENIEIARWFGIDARLYKNIADFHIY